MPSRLRSIVSWLPLSAGAAALLGGCAVAPLDAVPVPRFEPVLIPAMRPLQRLDDSAARTWAPLPAMRAVPRVERFRVEFDPALPTVDGAATDKTLTHERIAALARCVRLAKATLELKPTDESNRLTLGDARQRLDTCQEELLELLARCSRKEIPC